MKYTAPLFALAVAASITLWPTVGTPTAAQPAQANETDNARQAQMREHLRQRRLAEANGELPRRRVGQESDRAGGNADRSTDPLMAALDRDGDGTLSESEIRVAAASLTKLDRNGDGKLTAQELGSGPRRGRGGGSDALGGGDGTQPPAQRGEGVQRRGGDPTARLKQLDRNQDGRLSKDEMPAMAWQRMSRADQNGDDAIDQEELAAVIDNLRRNGNRRNDEERMRAEPQNDRTQTDDLAPVTPQRPPRE